MSETPWTPGPWGIAGVSLNTGNVSVGHRDLRIVIAEVTNAASFGDMLAGAMKRGGGGFEQDDCHTQHANARLIAAAPDLYAALVRAVEIANECSRDGHAAEWAVVRIDAMAAPVLAKARGEAP